MGGMCDRCRKLPWTALINGADQSGLFRGFLDQLQISNCRICRLLKSTCLYDGCEQPRIFLGWKSRGYKVGLQLYELGTELKKTRIGVVLKDKSPSEQDNTAPHLIHMVEFDEMKTWIRKCTERHSQRDEKIFSSLVNLRVIDCEDKGRRVITAPADVEFVGLSYVWRSFGCDSKTKSSRWT